MLVVKSGSEQMKANSQRMTEDLLASDTLQLKFRHSRGAKRMMNRSIDSAATKNVILYMPRQKMPLANLQTIKPNGQKNSVNAE